MRQSVGNKAAIAYKTSIKISITRLKKRQLADTHGSRFKYLFFVPVVELRKDTCRSAPVGARKGEDNDMASALNVISLRTQGRAKTAPALHGIRQSGRNRKKMVNSASFTSQF